MNEAERNQLYRNYIRETKLKKYGNDLQQKLPPEIIDIIMEFQSIGRLDKRETYFLSCVDFVRGRRFHQLRYMAEKEPVEYTNLAGHSNWHIRNVINAFTTLHDILSQNPSTFTVNELFCYRKYEINYVGHAVMRFEELDKNIRFLVEEASPERKQVFFEYFKRIVINRDQVYVDSYCFAFELFGKICKKLADNFYNIEPPITEEENSFMDSYDEHTSSSFGILPSRDTLSTYYREIKDDPDSEKAKYILYRDWSPLFLNQLSRFSENIGKNLSTLGILLNISSRKTFERLMSKGIDSKRMKQ